MCAVKKTCLSMLLALLAGLFAPAALAQSPTILIQPLSQVTVPGADVTFGVQAVGTGQLGYQWMKNGADLQGETGATLTLDDVTLEDAGEYSVEITDSLGAKVSNNARLTVGGLPQSPVITLQPIAQNVDAGGNVAFSVNATGTAPLAFQWMKDGVNIEGETGATLTLDSVTEAEAGNYSVKVSNAAGAAASAVARLNVDIADAPIITLQPLSQTVAADGTIVLTVAAAGDGQLRYQWKKNGSNLEGKTTATLTIPNAASADAGIYSVVVTDDDGATTSSNANVTVGLDLPPSIISQPGSQTVNAGARVTLSATATGSGNLTYQWKRNGMNIDGATGSKLVIDSATTAHAGDYTVTISNSAGSETSSVAKLTVNNLLTPVITAQPSSQAVSAGGSATFTANATGSGNLKFQWRKDGMNLEGETSSTLTIDSATAADAGDYSVIVSNDAGAVTSSNARLTVNAQQGSPVITLQPISQLVASGGDATFNASATGSGNLSFQWRKDGVNLEGETSSTLVIDNATAANEGSYSVVVSNEAGSTVSSSARLNVLTSLSGLLDLSFLANGISEVNATEILNDGKTLVAGKIEGLLGLAETGVARLNANGSADLAFSARTDAAVNDMDVQSDGKIVIGGDFSAVNGSNREGAARLNANGSVDSEFQVGAGANGSVESVEIQDDGKILLAGDFTSFNGAERNGLVRLNSNGSVDTSFNAGLNSSASDVDVQADGKILVAGNFTAAQGANRDGVIRLNADGTVDTSFDAGAAADASNEVTEIEIQGDGKILVAGNFDSFSGANSAGVARLNSNGSVDASFTSALSASSEVLTLEAQGDGKIVVGGDLSAQGGQNGSAVLRLNSNGSVDSSLSLGADGPEQVAAISLQGDGKIVIGGQDGLARIKSILDELAPRIMGITRAGENVEILIETEAGTNYVLESTTSLSNPQWTAVGNLSGDGSMKAFTNLATQEGNGFFRVRAE